MRRNGLSAVAILLLTCGMSLAQERPPFTGTWQSDTATLIITDTPALFTVERRTVAGAEKLTFPFIGQSEALERFGGTHSEVGGPTTIDRTSASWHDGHVDTFIVRQINGKTVTQNIVYTMEPGGLRMRVQQGLVVHHGYEGIQSGNTVTEIFAKR